jgi:AraC family transcriptional regulator, regulatory protein of adaptative response / methylated-DNA-[protein]-cysteine methyltransferase
MNTYDTITRAIEYMTTHASESTSLDDLATHLHLSSESVARTFSDWVGVSPKQFSRYLTLDYARKMLEKSSESQLTLSEQIGLSSQSRLHDLFTGIEAMTPEEYRNHGA